MVDKIINQSLPLGIDEEVDQSSYQLEDGDMIIMSSDGVVENLIDNDLLEEFISNAKDLAPQQIVYEILNYTIKNQIKTKDDMTVIVLKISTRKRNKQVHLNLLLRIISNYTTYPVVNSTYNIYNIIT